MQTPQTAAAPMGGASVVDRSVRQQSMRAWRIYVPAWQKEPMALTMATTRGKAIARCLASANEVGYALKWGDFKATRAPEFDGAYGKHGAFSWAYDHAMLMLMPNVEVQRDSGSIIAGGSAGTTGSAAGDDK